MSYARWNQHIRKAGERAKAVQTVGEMTASTLKVFKLFEFFKNDLGCVAFLAAFLLPYTQVSH